jgi:hypothetical protein
MAELTPEQLAKAETMSLDELRALALKETEEPAAPVKVAVEEKAPAQARDGKGRFTNADELEVPEEEAEEVVAEEPPVKKEFYRDIDNGNGVIERFSAPSLEELVDKIAEGKRNASIKIRELSQKVKVEDTRTAQQKADDDFVIAERFKKEPKKVVRELWNEFNREEVEAKQRSEEAQTRFVSTHEDFIANPDNGSRMISEVQRLGYTEITEEGLEKAYQNLKASGLLKLKSPEASATTEDKGADTERIAQPEPEAPQPRSPRKGSTISVRNRGTVTPISTQPTEDELYSMPLEKLKELANKQLRDNSGN